MARKLFLFLAMAIAALPLAGQAEGPTAAATHVWIGEDTSGAGNMAGFLTLQNLSSQALTLTSVSSPDFDSVMIEGQAAPAGKDEMQPVAKLTIPAHQDVVFAPDGYKLMFTKPVKRLLEGDLVTLILTFSDHSSLTIMAQVRHDQPQS